MRIQEIHRVQFCFDVLKLHFFNELKAFHKRRWTTQVRFGHLEPNIGHASPLSLLGDYPDPSTQAPHPLLMKLQLVITHFCKALILSLIIHKHPMLLKQKILTPLSM